MGYIWIMIFLLLTGCSNQQQTQAAGNSPDFSATYKQRSASRDGIGKVYLGREIARVMDPQNARWLDRTSRDVEELPDRVIEQLALKPSDVVADIGAGSGYFTFRLYPLVPEGKVLAVEIQPEMLEIIKRKKVAANARNVIPVLGGISDPNLPESGVDVVLMVDAYHEFSHPREMMIGIMRALKPSGRVFLIEYRGEDPRVTNPPLHKMTQAQAIKEMTAIGLSWRETLDFLPEQHFMVFEKPF
jgi:ubiquinone/menaquinone biosynthesis C-methylase UbiE